MKIWWVESGQRKTSENARIARIRSDSRAPEYQCWQGFPGNARIARQIEKTFSRNCQAGSADTHGRHQKVFKKCCASVQFSPSSCPARVCGERHAVRCRALSCDLLQRATVCAGHPCASGKLQAPHRGAIWTSPERNFRPAARSAKAKLIETKENAIYGQKLCSTYKLFNAQTINNKLPSSDCGTTHIKETT